MITPEPRLDACSSRDPNQSSWLPKNCRKIGSLANGEFEARTTEIAEMLTIPVTARPATSLKSGRPAVIGATRSAAETGPAEAAGFGCAGPACPSLPGQSRPVRTRPKTNPATTSTSPTVVLLNMAVPLVCVLRLHQEDGGSAYALRLTPVSRVSRSAPA